MTLFSWHFIEACNHQTPKRGNSSRQSIPISLSQAVYRLQLNETSHFVHTYKIRTIIASITLVKLHAPIAKGESTFALSRSVCFCYVFLIIFIYLVFAPRRCIPEESTTFPESLDDLANTSFTMIPAQIAIPAQFLLERREAKGMYSNIRYLSVTIFAQNKTAIKNYPTSFERSYCRMRKKAEK